MTNSNVDLFIEALEALKLHVSQLELAISTCNSKFSLYLAMKLESGANFNSPGELNTTIAGLKTFFVSALDDVSDTKDFIERNRADMNHQKIINVKLPKSVRIDFQDDYSLYLNSMKMIKQKLESNSPILSALYSEFPNSALFR